MKVKATGVCGSDVHISQKDFAGYTAYPGHLKLPVVLGRMVSKIVEVGKNVHTLRPGTWWLWRDAMVRRLYRLS